MDEFLSVDSVSIYYEGNEETYSFLLVDLERRGMRDKNRQKERKLLVYTGYVQAHKTFLLSVLGRIERLKALTYGSRPAIGSTHSSECILPEWSCARRFFREHHRAVEDRVRAYLSAYVHTCWNRVFVRLWLRLMRFLVS